MPPDQMFLDLIWASFLLAPLATLIVGSQSPEDSRSVATWAIRILGPMLLVGGVWHESTGRSGPADGALGVVVFLAALIAAVGLGHVIAMLRSRSSPAREPVKEVEPELWDDELA